MKSQDYLEIAGRKFNSRLLVGTGKYKDLAETKLAIEASGAEIVTVAVRRVNIEKKEEPMLQDFINPEKFTYLPNTAGCFTAKDAIRTLKLAKVIGNWNLVKLEVLSNDDILYPKITETIQAAELLVSEGFEVMVYTNDDPIVAKELEDIGCVAVMPLGAPIGSGLGIQNRLNIEIILSNAKVPILVDAGVGTASDASLAMEMGCDGVLMNSAIAHAKNPILMAESFKNAVISGRQSFIAGRMKKLFYADASSPSKGLI